MKKGGLFGLAVGKDHRKDYRQVAKVCLPRSALSTTGTEADVG